MFNPFKDAIKITTKTDYTSGLSRPEPVKDLMETARTITTAVKYVTTDQEK